MCCFVGCPSGGIARSQNGTIICNVDTSDRLRLDSIPFVHFPGRRLMGRDTHDIESWYRGGSVWSELSVPSEIFQTDVRFFL